MSCYYVHKCVHLLRQFGLWPPPRKSSGNLQDSGPEFLWHLLQGSEPDSCLRKIRDGIQWSSWACDACSCWACCKDGTYVPESCPIWMRRLQRYRKIPGSGFECNVKKSLPVITFRFSGSSCGLWLLGPITGIHMGWEGSGPSQDSVGFWLLQLQMYMWVQRYNKDFLIT